jgi:hypothetical protein
MAVTDYSKIAWIDRSESPNAFLNFIREHEGLVSIRHLGGDAKIYDRRHGVGSFGVPIPRPTVEELRRRGELKPCAEQPQLDREFLEMNVESGEISK